MNITAGDEQRVKEVLATRGPVSVTFHVADDFRHYHSGVYRKENCPNGPKDVNHAVLAVGYGHEDGLDYLLVKNSWDYTFGQEGYFKIEWGTNMCGLAQCNAYPRLAPLGHPGVVQSS